MILTDHLYLKLFVGTVEIPSQVVLNQISLISSYRQHVPVMELVLSDPVGVFKNLVSFGDSVPIQVTIGPTQDDTTTFNFRAFAPNQNPKHHNIGVHLGAYLDVPTYFGSTTTASIKGTSDVALSQIASAAGLRFVGNAAQDSQVWIPAAQRWCAFAHNISKAGWASDHSAFLLGVSLNGYLRYFNVGEYKYDDSSIPTLVIGKLLGTDQNEIPCTSHSTTILSGYHNFRGGYHGAQQNQSLLSVNGDAGFLTNVQKLKSSPFLNMNADVKGQMAGKLIGYSSIDGGNVHPKYTTALYQNERLLRTASSLLNVLTPVKTSLDLFDKIKVKTLLTPQGEGSYLHDDDTDGNYFIIKKTIHSGPSAIYCEKFVLVRDGHTTDPEHQGRDL